MAKKSKVISSANIIVDAIRIEAARASIVQLSNTLQKDIDGILKSVNKITTYWDSETAKYHKDTLASKVKDVQTEQEKMYKNLKQYLKNVMDKYAASEKAIIKNSDRFK